MDRSWNLCNIHYYLREKCYEKVIQISNNALSHDADAPEYSFYCGIACILEGQIQKGLAEITPLQSNKELHLGAVITLIFAHKKLNSIDRDALYGLETKLKEERKQANHISLYYAALFLSFSEKYEKASEYINKSLKKDPNNVNTIILKGWNDMYMYSSEIPVSILDCLELALSRSSKNVEALMGLAKYKYFTKDHENSNLNLDKLIVNNPGQVIPLVEKLRNDFAMQNWDAVYDSIDRILLIDPTNIEVMKIRIFLTLCKNSDYIEAADQLNNLYSLLEENETYNGFLFCNIAHIFSKICSRSSTILSQVYRFAQYASEIYSNNVDYLSEIGYQCILQGKIKDAQSFFKAASKIDSNSINALCGLTLCHMSENGSTEQIAQQVELLFEMQGTKKIPILYLLSAKLNIRNSTSALSFLNNAIDIKMQKVLQCPYSLSYINDLDPDFLLNVFCEYKKHLPKKPYIIFGYLIYAEESGFESVNKCMNCLELICKACPGLISALYELAKLKFLFGYPNEAQKLAIQISELDNTHAGCQVLLAQIYIQQQMYPKAIQCLEICLSYNFKVRDSAMYHLVNGIILKNANQLQDALSSYITSLNIASSKSNISNSNRLFESDLNIIDKATLYFEIIEIHNTLGQYAEAGKIMQEAIQELSFTSEEDRLVIARAEMALAKGDYDKANDILKDIKPGQPYYFQAHTKMAYIYLKEKNDRSMFTNCFKEIVSNHPVGDAHSLMGDAYISINEPEHAINSYETALRGNPNNIPLIKKLGAALVKTHDYLKATAHYESAIKNLNEDELKYEYIELLIKLKQYDQTDTFISSELSLPQNKEKNITALKKRVKLLLLQAKARDLKNTPGITNLILTQAKDLQTAVVKRIEIDSRGDLKEEKELLSFILCSLAKVKSAKESAVPANLYAEALIYTPKNPNTLLALAKLYAQMNNSEKCEQTCAVLLSADPNNELAAVMIADLAFRKVDLDTAYRHLSQILSVKPNSWEALAQLIEVQWRMGKLTDAEEALETAKQSQQDQDDPGYNYCAGLCSIYSGRANTALRQLNMCRRAIGSRWAQAAARRMVLLCVSQDAPDALADSFINTEEGDTKLLAIRTAEKLLVEVTGSDKRAFQAFLQLATKQKSQAERVLQDLLPLASEENFQDDPYLILALANAYNIIKQPTRAKNILKRTIASIQWTPENADGLERCWLEVADGQITSGRVDAARDLLHKIIAHNKSCSTAYQYLGFLAEKEQNYKLAAQNYDSAWVHSGKNNVAVGYKLAHAYLKLKKHPECIIICRHILKINPDYPKIRKEILDKAKTNLRT